MIIAVRARREKKQKQNNEETWAVFGFYFLFLWDALSLLLES